MRKVLLVALVLLPVILAIIGAKLWITGPALVMVFVICLIVVLVAFGKIKGRWLPWLLGSISLSMLWASTLITPYLMGTDIHTEYYYYQLAVDGWNPDLAHSYNGAVGLTVIAPFLTNFLHVDGYVIFKWIYPFIFSLTPVILFLAYRQFVSNKIAFLSSFVFLAFPAFFIEVAGITKMQLSAPFFAFLIYLAVKKDMEWKRRVGLAVTSGILVGLFYYSNGYILFMYLIALIGGLVVLRLPRFVGKLLIMDIPGFGIKKYLPLKGVILVSFLMVVPILIYFGWVGQGSPLSTLTFYAKEHLLNLNPSTSQFAIQIDTIRERWEEDQLVQFEEETGVRLGSYEELLDEARFINGVAVTEEEREQGKIRGEDISDTIERLLREPQWTQVGLRELGVLPGATPPPNAKNYLTRAALGLDILDTPWMGRVFRLLQLSTQGLIVVGAIVLFFRRRDYPDSWIVLMGASLFILLLVLVKPGFSSLLNLTRLYLFTLFFLSPLIVIGGCWVVGSILKKHVSGYLSLALIVPYFLFTSGFVFEVTNRPNIENLELPFNSALSSYRIDIYGGFSNNDKMVSDWIKLNLPEDVFVFADLHGMQLLYEWTHFRAFHFPQNWLPQDLGLIPQNAWVFLREWNEDEQFVTHWVNTGLRESVSYIDRGLDKLLVGREVIYKSGSAVVYGGRQ